MHISARRLLQAAALLLNHRTSVLEVLVPTLPTDDVADDVNPLQFCTELPTTLMFSTLPSVSVPVHQAVFETARPASTGERVRVPATAVFCG